MHEDDVEADLSKITDGVAEVAVARDDDDDASSDREEGALVDGLYHDHVGGLGLATRDVD
jgi:hypothetical protein